MIVMSDEISDDDIKEEVIETLKTIEDPELFLDIWFLGLIYDVAVEAGSVKVTMTFTTPLCPAGPQMIDQIKKEVGEIDGVEVVDVEVVFTPPWHPSDEVKGMLGMM